MEDIEEKAKRDAEKLWEEKLKAPFENKINLLINESMQNFEKQISDFEKTLNLQINELIENSNMNNNSNNNNNNNNNNLNIINNNNSNNNRINNNYNNNNNNNFNNNNNNNSNNYNNNLNNNNNNYNFNNDNNNNFNNNNNNNYNNINNFNNNSNNSNNNNYNNNINNNYNNNFNNNSNNNYNNNNNSYNNNNNNNFNNSNNNNYNNNNNNNFNNSNNYNYNNNNNFNNNSNNYNNNFNNNYNNNSYNNNNNNFNNNYNNNNNINFNNNNIIIENDNILRKKQIDIYNLQNPSFVILVQFNDTNPLINIILQCLSNIKTLLAYYFNPEKETKILKRQMENPNGVYLGGAFLKFLDNIWKSSNNQYNPYEVHQSLQNLMGNKYFSNDPGFIFNFILNQLHSELIQNPNINKVDESPDDKLCRQNFYQFFQLSSTKILASFTNSYKIKKRCQFCSQTQYLYEISFVLDIFLEENNENNLSSNKINLIDNLKTLLIDRENKIIVENCVNCGAPKNKFVNKYIYSTSEILIININRNKDINCNVSLEYPFQFNGGEVINGKISQYELVTVIKKFKNNNFFQFVAYYKSFVNKKWYLYNNQNIELVQNENELIDDKNTCLLIYSFIKSN